MYWCRLDGQIDLCKMQASFSLPLTVTVDYALLQREKFKTLLSSVSSGQWDFFLIPLPPAVTHWLSILLWVQTSWDKSLVKTWRHSDRALSRNARDLRKIGPSRERAGWGHPNVLEKSSAFCCKPAAGKNLHIGLRPGKSKKKKECFIITINTKNYWK